jgi:hypothetical protein
MWDNPAARHATYGRHLKPSHATQDTPSSTLDSLQRDPFAFVDGSSLPGKHHHQQQSVTPSADWGSPTGVIRRNSSITTTSTTTTTTTAPAWSQKSSQKSGKKPRKKRKLNTTLTQAWGQDDLSAGL